MTTNVISYNKNGVDLIALLRWTDLRAACNRTASVETPSEIAGHPRPGTAPVRAATMAAPSTSAGLAPAAPPLAAGAAVAPAPPAPAASPAREQVGVSADAPERGADERKVIAEIGRMVRANTKSTAESTWYSERNVHTGATNIKWARVGPLIAIVVLVGYGALRFSASDTAEASDTRAAGTVQDGEKEKKRGAAGDPTLPEESLFAPRSRYSVNGTETPPAGDEAATSTPPAAAAAPPPPARAEKAEVRKPSAPDSWQAGLYMDLPATDDVGEEEPVESSGLGITLREGTRIPATLVGTLASAYDAPVEARLDADFVEDGITVLPKGTMLLGRTEANVAQRRVYVRFHRAILPSGVAFEIRAAAQNADLSTGLTADRVEKHRSRNIVAGTLADVAGGAGTLIGIGSGSPAAVLAAQAARQQVSGEARATVEPTLTLYVNAGRAIFVYLEADLPL